MQLIAYKGKMYAFETKENECDLDAFISRCWFIVKNYDRFKDYAYLETLSHVWANCRYLNVMYDDHIMKELALCAEP